MNKKATFLVLVVILIFVIGGTFWFTKNRTITNEIKKYSQTNSITENNLIVTAIYPETFDNKGGKIKAELQYRTNEPFSIDPSLVRFYLVKNDASVEQITPVLSHAGTEPMQVSSWASSEYETQYFHSFVAETIVLPPSRYIIRASIDNGRFSSEKEIYIQDRSYIRDIDISADRITFDASNDLFKSFKSETLKGEANEETSFSMSQPGRIEFAFVPKMPPVYASGWDEVSLTVYPISEVVDWGPDEFANQFNLPYFVSNVRKLRELIRYGHFTENIYPINNFPPVNASPVGTQRITRLSFSNGDGVRFLVSGYHQAVDPADHPKYIYQGITDDGHHLVVFRYGSLFSPKLERYLKSFVWGVDADAYNTRVEKSFELLKQETNFSPSLEELDKFVKSIHVSPKWER